MFVRTWSDNNRWSLSVPRLLYKEAIPGNTLSPITKAEYFFDTDPGFGSGNNAALTAGNTVTFPITHDISGLSNGLHWMYVRTWANNNRWSITAPRLFYKEAIPASVASTLTKAEYFLDTDPGFGNGTDVPITQGTQATFTICLLYTSPSPRD